MPFGVGRAGVAKGPQPCRGVRRNGRMKDAQNRAARRMRMSDLAATFDAHVQAEFQDLDLDATRATMTEDPYVHHVPTATGGSGTAGVRDFYEHHFIGHWPDDPQIQPISRTVGDDQGVADV